MSGSFICANMVKDSHYDIPIWLKMNLTIQEAAAYSGIGEKRLREIIKDPKCDFVIYVGNKKQLIKRVEFEKWNSQVIYL